MNQFMSQECSFEAMNFVTVVEKQLELFRQYGQ